MSCESKLNLSDKDRQCELGVLESSLSSFGILQNSENLFCLECALIFLKEDSETSIEDYVYYECPACEKKAYISARSCYWIKKFEKIAFCSEYLRSDDDLFCQFCNKARGNCMHSAYIIDENKPRSTFNFAVLLRHLLSPRILHYLSRAGNFISNFFSTSTKQSHETGIFPDYDKSLKNHSVLAGNYEANKFVSGRNSFEIAIFSKKDFPLLQNSDSVATETDPSTTEVREPKRLFYTYITRINDFEENQVGHEYQNVPVVDLPPEYNRQLPPECKIEDASPLPFLPDDSSPIYSVTELKGSYDQNSLKARNMDHVLKELQMFRSMHEVDFNNDLGESSGLFSICFSSGSRQELWTKKITPSSSTQVQALTAKTEQKYLTLSKYIVYLNDLLSEKNNKNTSVTKSFINFVINSFPELCSVPRSSLQLWELDSAIAQIHTPVRRYTAQLDQLPPEKNIDNPFIKSAIDFYSAYQNQSRKNTEHCFVEVLELTPICLDVIDIEYYQSNNKLQLQNFSKVTHIESHKQPENVNDSDGPKAKFDLGEKSSNDANAMIYLCQNNLSSNHKEATESKHEIFSNMHINAAPSNDFTLEQFWTTEKHISSRDAEIMLGKSPEAQQQNESLKNFQEQPNKKAPMQTHDQKRCQESYFLTNYLHPYKQIQSIRCKMESLGAKSMKYHHVELGALSDVQQNSNNRTETIACNQLQRNANQAQIESYPEIKDSSRILARLQISYNETRTSLYREEMSRYNSSEYSFGSQVCTNLQSCSNSNSFPPIRF